MKLEAFSRKGGQARSPAKTAANRAKALSFWEAVRAGEKPAPRRPRVPPSAEAIGSLLAEFCHEAGITRLEVFGSVARGDARKGSDVDLIVTFSGNPGLDFHSMEGEMTAIVGAPVHLLSRDSVENMNNPLRRESILADARVIYAA
jgi:predicted nucleotidyltransferase